MSQPVNSSAEDKAAADFVCDGTDDQDEINAALAALGGEPGTVHLCAGNYQLTRDPSFSHPTAIAIQQSGVTLEGAGYDTALWLGDNQYCNMIRSIGDGLDHIYVQDLRLYGNRENNQHPTDPNAWLETNAIYLRSTGAEKNHHLGVERIWAEESRGLNVYIGGNEVYVRNSVFGDATADVVELVDGSVGEISHNVAHIDGATGHVFGTDAFNNATIIGNTTHVYDGGFVSQGVHRLWPNSYFNQLVDNTVIVDTGGLVERAIAALGYHNLIENNVITVEDFRTKVVVNGSTLVDGNFFQNVDIEFDDVGVLDPINLDNWPIIVSNNLGDDVTIAPALLNLFLDSNNFDNQSPPVAPPDDPDDPDSGPVIFVAASNSSAAEQALADFVCDGVNDQDEINAALASLGGVPGTVHLFGGNYHLSRDASLSHPTAIAIQQSGVILGGDGYATALWLDDGQYCNMIRSIGDGLEDITIRDLRLNGNRANNTHPTDPLAWLETNAINLQSTGSTLNQDLEVERIWAEESAGFNVYIGGTIVYVRDSEFGDATMGIVMLVDGSEGEISGNVARIDGNTGLVFAADQFSDAAILANTTHIYAGGIVSQAVHGLLAGSNGGQIIYNKLFVNDGAVAERGIAALSLDNLVKGNVIVAANAPTRVLVNGDTQVVGNFFQNLGLALDDPDPLFQPANPDELPILFSDNLGTILTLPSILPDYVTFDSNYFMTSLSPAITSDGAGSTATNYVFEGETAITTLASSDRNPDPALTYSIFSGEDQDKFEIDPQTGALVFKDALQFAQPLDADGNNSYVVAVRVSDGALTDSQVITVNVGGTLDGDEFENTLTGGPGHDQIDGKGANDIVDGGTGNDTILGGAGADALNGAGGDDVFLYSSASELEAGETVDGGDGIDALTLAGEGYAFADATVTSVERLIFSATGGASFAANQLGAGSIAQVHGSDGDEFHNRQRHID